MPSKADQDKLDANAKELFEVLNFLKDDEYRDPNSKHLRKDGRGDDYFKDFHQYDKVYHTTETWDKHGLKCYMLIPKALDTAKPVPFHVFFHGGGLCTGGGNYIHWFHDYKLNLAIDANAITLIPMYRLMPESNGQQIYQDVEDWWKFYKSSECEKWVKEKLAGKTFDLSWDRLLVSGESAGGLLAVHSWLTGPIDLKIRALYLQYPMLHYYEKDMADGSKVEYMKLPIKAEKVREHAKALISVLESQGDFVVSRSDDKPPIGMLAAMMLSNTKLWRGVFQAGNGTRDAPDQLRHQLEERQPPKTFPKLFIVHGDNDPAVPIWKTVKFKELLEQAPQQWGTQVDTVFKSVPGAPHGFDYEYKKDGNSPGEKIVAEVVKQVHAAWY